MKIRLRLGVLNGGVIKKYYTPIIVKFCDITVILVA